MRQPKQLIVLTGVGETKDRLKKVKGLQRTVPVMVASVDNSISRDIREKYFVSYTSSYCSSVPCVREVDQEEEDRDIVVL